MSLSVAAGPPTSTVKVSGSGFPASVWVDIYFDTTHMQMAVTNGTGAFSSLSMQVPAGAVPGTHWITAGVRYSAKAAQKAFIVRTDWAQFRMIPRHKGLNAYENVLNASTVEGLDLDWKYTTGNNVVSSPAVTSGRVHVGSTDGKVYALTAATGALVWSASTGGVIYYSSPAVADGVVYIGSTDDSIYAFDLSNQPAAPSRPDPRDLQPDLTLRPAKP